MPIQLNQKSWSCPNKIVARRETIINQYRSIFGKNSVPFSRQYWTMCGQCTELDGQFQEGCELDQLLSEGFIQPNQFHGVDINENIIEANRKAFPGTNWYAGDFYQSLIEAHARKGFCPAVVNADFINMPMRACGYLADIMALLSICPGEVLIIANMVLEYQRFEDRNKNAEFIIEKMNSQPQFQFSLHKANWMFDQKYYRYAGTGVESRTVMGSVLFYKKR